MPMRPKPVNCSYSQNAPFDKMKTSYKFSPFWDEKIFIVESIASNLVLDLRSQMRFQGCRDAKEVEVEGSKTMSRKE